MSRDPKQFQFESKPDDVVIFIVPSVAVCAVCSRGFAERSMFRFIEKKIHCMQCAGDGWAGLTFLPRGDVALTRRAVKHSSKSAIVVEWNRRRKRYERQGTLVAPNAIERAKLECAADADKRAAKQVLAAKKRAITDAKYIEDFAAAVRSQFPAAPKDVEQTIAQHACEKYSGRVGRTADAKELDSEMVKLAVIAHIRHLHTDYDRIIGRYNDKQMARDAIREKVQSVLREWSAGSA